MEAYGGVSVKNLPIDRQWDAGFRGSLNPPPIAKLMARVVSGSIAIP
jgi:hypothetical protein